MNVFVINNNMEDFKLIICCYLSGIVFIIGMWVGYNPNSWNNGVKEGRCIERGGAIHNVDGELTCLDK